MGSLVFSLGSEDAARVAGSELSRNGVKSEQIRILDRPARVSVADAANNPAVLVELDREAAQGRVLLEIVVDEQNLAAVERLMFMLGGDTRKFVVDHPAAEGRVASTLED